MAINSYGLVKRSKQTGQKRGAFMLK
uniref:Uncharacterized protein n=1 Tax=Rhizophora mucronata TaxID=61149 RepID=A0A2P2QEF8_RHIMU